MYTYGSLLAATVIEYLWFQLVHNDQVQTFWKEMFWRETFWWENFGGKHFGIILEGCIHLELSWPCFGVFFPHQNMIVCSCWWTMPSECTSSDHHRTYLHHHHSNAHIHTEVPRVCSTITFQRVPFHSAHELHLQHLLGHQIPQN